MKIISLNLNGIRSATNKGVLSWLKTESADIVCLQELKAQANDMTAEMLSPDGYVGHFHYAEKKGYSGVGIYSKIKPDTVIIGMGGSNQDVADIDCEGQAPGSCMEVWRVRMGTVHDGKPDSGAYLIERQSARGKAATCPGPPGHTRAPQCPLEPPPCR